MKNKIMDNIMLLIPILLLMGVALVIGYFFGLMSCNLWNW